MCPEKKHPTKNNFIWRGILKYGHGPVFDFEQLKLHRDLQFHAFASPCDMDPPFQSGTGSGAPGQNFMLVTFCSSGTRLVCDPEDACEMQRCNGLGNTTD